jgi:flagellar biosynthesis protein FlhG
VGKSFLSANLGALMAKYGYRVALIDLDLGASNLHTILGVKKPKYGLHTFLENPAGRLEHIAVPIPVPKLAFIGSVDCSMEIANLYHAQKIKLINAIKKLTYDYILLDLGAGTNFNTLDFFLTSDQGIVVCTSEPTSIENAFRFIKAVYLRKIKQIIKHNAFPKMVKDVVSESGCQGLRSMDIIDLVARYGPGREFFLRESLGRFQFKLILNQLRKNGDPTLGEKIISVLNRHFYFKFDFLGGVDFDDRVSGTISNKTLFALQYPDTKVSISLSEIAGRLTSKRMTIHKKSRVL